MKIAESLGLDSLGGINYEEGSLAGGQRTRNFIAKINMPRGVDEIKNIILAVLSRIVHAHGGEFDGDASFSFDGVAVHHLRL